MLILGNKKDDAIILRGKNEQKKTDVLFDWRFPTYAKLDAIKGTENNAFQYLQQQ
jgi:hypothetical protein